MEAVEAPSVLREYSAFRSCPLLRSVSEELCRSIWEDPLCRVVRFSGGERIASDTFGEGAVGILLCGAAYAEKCVEGNRTLLRLLPVGSLFGVASLWQSRERTVSEITSRSRSTVAFLPQSLLERLFASSPEAAKSYIVFLTERIRYLNTRIDAFTAGSAVSRLRHYFCSLVTPDDLPCEIPVTCSRLASMLDIGRASLYRALDALEGAGAIQKDAKTVRLLPPLFSKDISL